MANNVIFNDEVIEKKFESVLATKLDLQQFVTVDNQLAENSGMIKKIVTKSATGAVEDLAMGVGNSDYITATSVTVPYEVGVTQGKFKYFDEEALRDDKVVEAGITGMAEIMSNDFTSKAIAEFGKATILRYGQSWSFDNVVDAIAAMPYVAEDEAKLFMLIAPDVQASIRKNLKDDLKYSEGFVRTGYIGSVCGVPVYVSKAIPEKTAFLASKEAVTLFVKKGVEVESLRDPDTRANTEFIRKVALVALTDARQVVKMSSKTDPRTGYTLLTEKPSDWATGTYYHIVNDVMVAKTTEDFVVGYFYSEND